MKKHPKKELASVTDAAEAVEKTVEHAIAETNKAIDPVRKSVARRYPTLFLFAVTFGVAAVFFGFERILGQVAFLDSRPWLILLLGIAVLAITGRLYKKLE